jgi:hypothetical protein
MLGGHFAKLFCRNCSAKTFRCFTSPTIKNRTVRSPPVAIVLIRRIEYLRLDRAGGPSRWVIAAWGRDRDGVHYVHKGL